MMEDHTDLIPCIITALHLQACTIMGQSINYEPEKTPLCYKMCLTLLPHPKIVIITIIGHDGLQYDAKKAVSHTHNDIRLQSCNFK